MRRVPLWLTAAFLLLVLCTAAVTARHEAWVDETDTWLLMRDGGVGTMLARTGYEGAPAVWYLLIAPLAAAGLPFAAQQVLNLLIAWIALCLFVYKAPFHPLVRLAFLFSYFAAWEFTVIARSYALLMAVLFAIAACWPDRGLHPIRIAALVAILANVSGHGLIVGAAIGAAFLFESLLTGAFRRRSTLAAILLMIAGGILSAWQLRVPPDGPRVVRHFDPGTIPFALGAMILPLSDPRVSFALGLLLLLAVTLAVGRHAVPLTVFSLAMATLLVFYQYVWYGGARHSGILLIVVIASLWMAAGYEAREAWRDRAFLVAEVGLALAVALSIPATMQMWREDWRGPFSGSRETAAFIEQHVPAQTQLAAYPTIQTEPVLAYLPRRRFWYASLGTYGSYMEWGRRLDEAQSRVFDPVAEVRRRFGDSGWVLVSAVEFPQPDGMRLVFHSRSPFAIHAESYWIYEPVARPQ